MTQYQNIEGNQDDLIKKLRIFFRISNIAFETGNNMAKAFGAREIKISPIHQLHKLALDEIEKENPNLEHVLSLIDSMEQIAENELFFKNIQNFKEGCILHKQNKSNNTKNHNNDSNISINP